MGGKKLGDITRDKKTIIVANAEPYQHVFEGDKVVQKKVPGGLTTGLDPIMLGSDNVWVGWGRGEADFQVTDDENKIKVPDDAKGYTLKRVKLSKDEIDGFYYGFANRTLWPLCHSFPQRTDIDGDNWEIYRKINKRYAQSALEVMDEGDRVFVHDYHLALVPKYIREKHPDADIALFWHIPWPPWEIFGTLPWRKKIIKGMVSADMIGFHTPWIVHNFLDAVRKVGGAVKVHEDLVRIDGDHAVVKNIPFGIDCEAYTPTEEQRENSKELRSHFGNEQIVLSLDRLDYTKGIDKRLDAIRKFLNRYPEYERKVVFIQKITPSRDIVSEYKKMKENIEMKVARINGEFQKQDWMPIRYFYQYMSHEELLTYYLASDIALVTPLTDGMNLVAKEFVYANEKGVLILSEFAGAAESLTEAILVNPHNTSEVAEAIHEALEIPASERRKTCEKMSRKIGRMDVHWWRKRLLEEWEISCFKK
ncbi:MAG: trehalose-6-phosphate synthase [Thermoplasmata archaeon]